MARSDMIVEVSTKETRDALKQAQTVIEAAKAAMEKTSNADGMRYIVECEAWDALHEALRPFLPAPDPEMVF